MNCTEQIFSIKIQRKKLDNFARVVDEHYVKNDVKELQV